MTMFLPYLKKTKTKDNYTTGYVAGMLQEILDLHEVCELEANNGPRLGELPSRPHEGWHITGWGFHLSPRYISSTMGSTFYQCLSETESYPWATCFTKDNSFQIGIGQNIPRTNIPHSCVKYPQFL